MHAISTTTATCFSSDDRDESHHHRISSLSWPFRPFLSFRLFLSWTFQSWRPFPSPCLSFLVSLLSLSSLPFPSKLSRLSLSSLSPLCLPFQGLSIPFPWVPSPSSSSCCCHRHHPPFLRVHGLFWGCEQSYDSTRKSGGDSDFATSGTSILHVPRPRRRRPGAPIGSTRTILWCANKFTQSLLWWIGRVASDDLIWRRTPARLDRVIKPVSPILGPGRRQSLGYYGRCHDIEQARW